MIQLTIRPMAISELQRVQQFQIDSFNRLAAEAHTNEQLKANEHYMRNPAYLEELQRCHIVVAEAKGNLLGTAGWGYADKSQPIGRIRKVFVAPDYAGMGIGKKLVEFVESKMIEVGCRKICVRSNINAQKFYQALGFKFKKKGVMPVGFEVELPVVFMEKITT